VLQILSELNEGECGYVVRIQGNFAVKNALQTAGFLLGTKIVVLRISPYKNTLLLDVGGQIKSYKKSALNLIELEILKRK